MDEIRYSCDHILHLVIDLLYAHRLNEICNLCIYHISEKFSLKANAKALIFYSKHENSIFMVKGNADKLGQGLANLLINAI